MQEDGDSELKLTMQEEAAAWAASARRLGVEMDFSPGSIQAAEELIPHLLAIGERNFGDDPDEKAAFIRGVTSRLGAYLGETMRRVRGGRWTDTGNGFGVVLSNGVTAFPMNKVGKRLKGDKSDDIRSFFDIATDVDLRSRLSPHRDDG